MITDTHGDIDIINQLLRETRADYAVHCGDFGFYDEHSVERLSERELRLRLKHSSAPWHVRKTAFDLEPDALRDTLRELGLLDTLVPYFTGERRFERPVYAVWGNHEDLEVVRALKSGERTIPNLELLDETRAVDLEGGVRLLGLGGNWYLEGHALFARDVTGHGGKVRASWPQYAWLMQIEAERRPARWPIFISHVSPGKARILERLALVMGARMVFSGHMGPPMTQVYSLFSFCESHEALARSQDAFEQLQARFAQDALELDATELTAVQESLDRLDVPPLPPPERGRRAAPGSLEHRFFTTQFINLADAPSYGILEIDADRPPMFRPA